MINLHLTQAEMNAINNALATVKNTLANKCRNITPQERQQYGSIKEQNKLLVNKVRDLRTNQTGMSSPNVDWTEFEADFQDRNFLEVFLLQLKTIAEMAEDTKILHDFDVYQAALLDYSYTKYMTETSVPGYDTKYEELKQFFPNTGGGAKPSAEAAPEE